MKNLKIGDSKLQYNFLVVEHINFMLKIYLKNCLGFMYEKNGKLNFNIFNTFCNNNVTDKAEKLLKQ